MRFSRYFLTSLTLAFGAVHASGFEVTSGTYVAGYIGPDFLIMGADSRINYLTVFGSAGHTDNDCKFTILDDKAAFVSIGSASITINGRMIFDSDASAREAYRTSKKSLHGAAERWAARVAEVIASSAHDTLTATNGVFFGFDDDGRTHMTNVGITTDGKVIAPQDLFWDPSRSSYIISMSHSDLSNLILSTDEAKAIRENRKLSEPTRYGDLVQLLIRRMIEQRNAAGDDGIGGDAAILVLSRGQRPSWPYPTAACDKKQN